MSLILLGLAGNMIQLVPDGTLLLHLLVIIVMVAILSRTLFKPINQILEERDRQSEGLLTEAEQMSASVEESLKRYEQNLRSARAEGYALLEKQRTDAVRAREKEIASAREELSDGIAQERAAIVSQVEQARAALVIEARNIAERIGSQILGRPLKSLE